MSSLEQIKQLTKRRVNGLFFIKNKHAVPTYKNHSYFEESKKISSSQSSSIASQLKKDKKWSMFVKQPTDYGLSNTYQYLKNRTSPKKYETIDQERRTKTRDKYSSSRYGRMRTQPGSHGNILPSKNYYDKSKLHNLSNTEQKLGLKKEEKIQPEHIVELTYISPSSNIYNSEALINTNRLRIDLLPFIIKTFRKCKINYQKSMSASQYQEIRHCIQQTYSMPKVQYDIKDLINLDSVQEILNLLETYSEHSIEWIQSIRHFFVAPEDIAAYQFQKMIDELCMLTVLNFNVGIQGSHIYVYRAEDRMEIKSIYGLLKEGTYIYGVQKNIIDVYEQIQRIRRQRQSYQRRIKRWRNVANLPNSSNLQQGCTMSSHAFVSQYQQPSNKIMSKQKFNRIYEHYKLKHRRSSGRPKSIISLNQTQQPSTDKVSFIDRSKLNYSQDIFE